MRLTFLIFLMWLVPFQAVWSASHALHGHPDTTTTHGHGHQHDGAQGDDGDLGNAEPSTPGDDGHHGSHAHPAFAFMVADSAPGLTDTLAEQPPPTMPASFTSHIPPLPDPPPVVRI